MRTFAEQMAAVTAGEGDDINPDAAGLAAQTPAQVQRECEVGEGPYGVEKGASGEWFVTTAEELGVSAALGPYSARKAACRKARELNKAYAEAGELSQLHDPNGGDFGGGDDPADDTNFNRVMTGLNEAVELAEGASSLARHHWLEEATKWATARIEAADDVKVDPKTRVSFGWASSPRFVGECWAPQASEDGAREIFIVPSIKEPWDILSTLTHELCHAAHPYGEKHGRNFTRTARAAGLTEGKPTGAYGGAEFKADAEAWLEKHPYPAAALNRGFGMKKQTTRLLKLECPGCGYVIRTTAKWVERGVPVCGPCGEDFEVA